MVSGDLKPFIKYRVGMQPITHRKKHVIRQFEEMKIDGSLKGKFKTPENLTILTCHNYDYESILEQNLKYLGVEYILLKEIRKPFKYIYKLENVLEYLNGHIGSEYILFCDADDVIIRDDLNKIIEIFKKKNCDLLFNSTYSKCGWLCMMDKREWYLTIGKMGRYLNSGVYIGKWEFVKEVLTEACKYITPDSLGIDEYNKTGRGQYDTRLCKQLPNYPTGAPDQDIFRYIHQKFYPRMKVDINNELVYRN